MPRAINLAVAVNTWVLRAPFIALLLPRKIVFGRNVLAFVFGLLNAPFECDKVLKAKPALARAWTNRAFALYHLKRLPEALKSADRAIAAGPNLQDAHICRATVLLALDHKRLATEIPAVALTAEEQSDLNALRAATTRETDNQDLSVPPNDLRGSTPGIVLRASEALNVARRVCHWNTLDLQTRAVFDELKEARTDARPYILLLTPASPERQKEAAELYFRSAFGNCVPRSRASTSGSKIRVAYLSSDFCDHPVAHVVAGLLEAHDRSRFEITCVALGGDAASPPRQRIVAACDRLIDVAGKSDEEIIGTVRALNVDIAVDLNGYTRGARTAIFASGIAPIQVNYLGYPGTLGSACYDYIIGDPVTTPLEHASHFTERLALLPRTYFPANRGKGITQRRAYSRCELNLPENDFVFCCFNGAVKITPDLFDIWMRLLKTVDRSVLWLSYTSAEAARNLRAEARKRGVPSEHLIFAPRTTGQDYLWRQAAADLFLDTFYYGAHSTAADALVMGLPILTRRGNTFASRVAASLLTVAGAHELVAHDAHDYESKALLLATQPAMLACLRNRLEQEIAAGPLFDIVSYARHLESAYMQMWRRCQAGLGPDHIVVSGT